MPFASMTSEDVAAFYSLLDDYFESRQELFASWASARAPAAPAAAPSSSRAAPPSSSRTTAPPPPAVQSSYRPSTPASPPLASPAVAGSDGPRAPAAQNKYGVTVPSMSDFKDPRFQSAFKVAGTGMSKAGGLINKHVLGGQDHSKTNAGAGAMDGPAAGGAATPPPKAAKPGGFGGVNMGTFRDAAKGMQAMNQINRAFSPQSAEAPAAAAAAPPPPPPAPTGAALPPPSRTGAPPPAQNGGIGSCTALHDYEAAEAGDLGFNEGDKITILSKESADCWRGSLHGREGLFPAAYVQQN